MSVLATQLEVFTVTCIEIKIHCPTVYMEKWAKYQLDYTEKAYSLARSGELGKLIRFYPDV